MPVTNARETTLAVIIKLSPLQFFSERGNNNLPLPLELYGLADDSMLKGLLCMPLIWCEVLKCFANNVSANGKKSYTNTIAEKE